ncbi:hypothetical protein [Pedobacter glucosidilyticus]|uniref:hypothetical protein n=1 Tax=Pedobacter glucosidilyticus TaxID=1122941 RepID=UPI000427941D|nr:hypothetical protein [Pedobacter glucosidilyticus]
MKILSSLFFLSISFFGCNASKVELYTYKHKSKYALAYNYLIQDQINQKVDFNIADSTVNIDLSPFYEELSLLSHKSKEKMLFLLDSLNHSSLHDHSVNVGQLIRPKKNVRNESNSTIYFSKVYDDFLGAEILDDISSIKENYKNATVFNKGMRYLFLFDKSGEIKNVYKKEIQYD